MIPNECVAMLFVPLPLFATLFLALLFVRFVLGRDMRLFAHQILALLVALYATQSLLSSLRWGYGIDGVAILAILLAPVLPSIAYFAYRVLSGQKDRWALWPIGIVGVNWLVFATLPDVSDATILMTYIGFGILLLRLGYKGVDHLSLSPFGNAQEVVLALYLTGAALIASGLTDVYVIYDFVQNNGQNAGLVLTFVQTGFVLVIGVAGVFGRTTEDTGGAIPAGKTPGPSTTKTTETAETTDMSKPQTAPTQADSDIIAAIETLFTEQHLHRDEELNLRRLSRRLGLPERQVSTAINRLKNLSVSQFVNRFRIHDACEMLRETDRSILDVSLAAGFATKSNFNREFLRVTGQNPSQWRAENS